jgi:hypothetical protein
MGPSMRALFLFCVLALFPLRDAWATTGGDSRLRILGWSAAHSTAFVLYMPGGEWEMAELWAFNLKEQVLERAECETCSQMTPSPPGADDDERGLSPMERGYLEVLRKAKKLGKLESIAPQDATATGLTFRCDPPRRRRCEDNATCIRHACTLTVVDGESERVEFDARDKWSKVRLFKIPGFPKAALAWIIHRGTVESGYREDKVVFVPKLKRKTIKVQRFATKYF